VFCADADILLFVGNENIVWQNVCDGVVTSNLIDLPTDALGDNYLIPKFIIVI
jgi:hypothetical protein